MKKTFYYLGYLISFTNIRWSSNWLNDILRSIYSGMEFHHIDGRNSKVLWKHLLYIISAKNISIGVGSSSGKRWVRIPANAIKTF